MHRCIASGHHKGGYIENGHHKGGGNILRMDIIRVG